MSLVPYTTQMAPQAYTQGSSQHILKVNLVYTDRMSERQIILMKDCQDLLSQYLETSLNQANQLDSLPPTTKFFVIPTPRDDLIKKIRSLFEKPVIYLPRAIIEARRYLSVNLPIRTIAISLAMYNCRIFLVKSCDIPSIRNKINEMCGTIVTSFNDPKINVVVTDKADNKYCSKAFKRNIPVVNRDWVDESYNLSFEEESGSFNRDALASVREHQIKPFYGLYFKIALRSSSIQIKRLITDNHGHIIYGNENCLTHIVGGLENDNGINAEDADTSENVALKPKIVNLEFLEICAEKGYYLTKRDYQELKAQQVVIKQEKDSSTYLAENHTPPIDNIELSSNGARENHQSMLPPPANARPLRQQQHQQQLQQQQSQQQQQAENNNVSDMILKALTSQNEQTQLASTQMRKLPDPELRIEQTYEPSQQLYWNDSVSKRS